MNRMDFILIVLMALLWAYIIQIRFCDNPTDTVTTDTVTTYDTVYVWKTSKPKIASYYYVDTLNIPDTIKLVDDYKTAKIYIDSLINDTISIAITDTILYNAIQGRSIAYTMRYPTKTVTNTITNNKRLRGLYISANMGLNYSGGVTYVSHKYIGSLQYGNNGVVVGFGVRLF